MEAERGRFCLSPSISPRGCFPSNPRLQTHQYRSRLAPRHLEHASARWEPRCGSLLPLRATRQSKARQGCSGTAASPPTCEHTRLSTPLVPAQPGTPGMLLALSDAVIPRSVPGEAGRALLPGGLCCLEGSAACSAHIQPGCGCPEEKLPGLASPRQKGFAPPGGICRGVGAAGAPSERPGCGGRASRAVPQHPWLVPGEAGTALDAPAGSTAPRRTREWGQSQPHQGPVNSPRATILRSQSFQAKESGPMDGESRAASRTYAEPRPEPQLSRSLGINQPG